MVGRFSRTYIASTCYPYVKGFREDYPVLRVKLYNVAMDEYGSLDIAIDTGFEGSILLPSNIYEFFMIGELPRSMWRTYRTLTGFITMRIARAIVEVNNVKIETFVETPLYGGEKTLIGRELLNKLTLVLDGLKKELCIVEQSST